MSESPATPEQPPMSETAGLQRMREMTAGVIAILVVGGLFVLAGLALASAGDEARFNRVRDLLLIINPLVGVVIGYYFNKTSTDARAEQAEATARGAQAGAQASERARERAEQGMQAAQARSDEAMAVLSEVSDSAQAMLNQEAAAGAPLLGGAPGSEGDAGRAAVNARADMQAALARARRLLQR